MAETETETEEFTKQDEDFLYERIGRARTKLIARLPFFGHLSLKLRPRLARDTDGVPTAAVAPDGTLVFNRKFLRTLDDAELCFVLAHEVMHPALLYFDRMQGRLPRLWNIAHDYAINLIIKSMGNADIKPLDDIRIDDKYRDWSAEEIYDDLLKDAVHVNLISSTGDDDGQSGDGGQPGRGKGRGKRGKGKGKGQGRHDILNDPLFGDARPDLSDSEDGKRAARGDKGAQSRIDTDWKISIVAAAQKHEQDKGRGSMPGGLLRMIDELVNPKIHWLEKLSRWVGEYGRRVDYTYQRPSRRSSALGQYMPSLKKYGFQEVTVMMDTSGSISRDMLKEGVSEVQGICEDLGIGVRCMIIDAALHDDVEVADAWELMDHLSGGGGSDFRPAFEKLKEEGYTGVVVAFTDGAIAVPHDKPENLRGVLWCLYEGCRAPCDWGEEVFIPRQKGR